LLLSILLQELEGGKTIECLLCN